MPGKWILEWRAFPFHMGCLVSQHYWVNGDSLPVHRVFLLLMCSCLGLLLDHLFCVSLYSWAILATPLCSYICHHLGRKAIALILLYQHFFTTEQPACQAFILKENLVVVLTGVALSQSPPPSIEANIHNLILTPSANKCTPPLCLFWFSLVYFSAFK